MSILNDSPHLTDHDDTMVDEYRAVCIWAVIALICGLLGPLALVDIWLSVFPLAGIVTAVIALVRIALLAPALTGRKAALAALYLSVLSVSAAAVDSIVFWRAIDQEAGRFAHAWFGYLANGQLHQAFQVTRAPGQRVQEPQEEPEEQVEPEDQEGARAEGLLQETAGSYRERPVVRYLLKLGENAMVQYRETEGAGRDTYSIYVRQIYAVTAAGAAPDAPAPLIRLVMQRIPLEDGAAAWRMADVEFIEGTEPPLEEDVAEQ